MKRIISRMLAKGKSIEEIVEDTGLTDIQIKEIASMQESPSFT